MGPAGGGDVNDYLRDNLGQHAEPRWCRVASLDIQAHNGALPCGRKRTIAEEDVAALVALLEVAK